MALRSRFLILLPYRPRLASDKSMLAAMITLDKATVFIKMTGSVASVKENKDHFLTLLRSIVRE